MTLIPPKQSLAIFKKQLKITFLSPTLDPLTPTHYLKGLVHFRIKISWSFTDPHVIQDVYVFLSSVEKKLCFLRKTFQDFSQWASKATNGLKVQIVVSVQLQRALQDPRWGISVLSRETNCHFLKKIIKMYILFNHKCSSCTSSAMRHALLNHVGKVMCDVGRSRLS